MKNGKKYCYTTIHVTCELSVDSSFKLDSYLFMINAPFLSSDERQKLLAYVKSHREDSGVVRRANALLLLDDGESFAQIAKFLYLDDDTVRRWHKQYLSGGWEDVAHDGWKGGQSRMTSAQEDQLCTWLDGRFCRTTVEIRAYILNEFNLRYSHSGCIKLLARLDFVYRKPKKLPKVADEERQAKFIADYEKLVNGLKDDEVIYFVDAVHPEYQNKPSFGWMKRGSNIAVKTNTGHGRVNIHAALNLENFHTSFTAMATVDGKSSVQLLTKVEDNNPNARVIHVFLDNAGYHRGPDVRAFLSRENCRIRLIPLPPYCPHLNPIERLWKVMHERVTHNRYYETERLFTNAILNFFRETIPREWPTFRDQVSDNFRIISHDNFRMLE